MTSNITKDLIKQRLSESAADKVVGVINEMRDLPDNAGFGLTRAQVETMLNTWVKNDVPPESYDIPEPHSIEGVLKARLHTQEPVVPENPQPVRPEGLMPYDLVNNQKFTSQQAVYDQYFGEEQIDELSKATLGSYINKASDKKAVAAAGIVTSTAPHQSSDQDYHAKKFIKRTDGIKKAVKKLTESSGKEQLIPVQHVIDAAHKVLGQKQAVNTLTHLRPGTDSHTTWDKVNTALSNQGVAKPHIAKILTHISKNSDVTEEQIDELSKATLGSYISKASKSAVGLGKVIGHFTTDVSSDPEPLNTARRQVRNRMKGIDHAVSKLSEDLAIEEFTLDEIVEFMLSEEYGQLDELSKKTLGNYVNKASSEYGDYKFMARVDPKKENAQHYNRKANNRFKGVSTAMKKLDESGISRAVSKLVKESIEAFVQTEEYNQLDEVSKELLGRYINKATADVGRKMKRSAEYQGYADKTTDYNSQMRNYDDAHAFQDKAKQRRQGVAQAVKKLTGQAKVSGT